MLPSRLQKELDLLEEYIADGVEIASNEQIAKHAEWAADFAPLLRGRSRELVRTVLEEEVGRVFTHVLEDAGVFKRDDAGRAAFLRLIATLWFFNAPIFLKYACNLEGIWFILIFYRLYKGGDWHFGLCDRFRKGRTSGQ